MTAESSNPIVEPDGAELHESESLAGQLRHWIRTYAAYWGTSFSFHMILLAVALLFFGNRVLARKAPDEDVVLQAAAIEKENPPEVDPPIIEPGSPDLELSKLTTETLMLNDPPADPPGGGEDPQALEQPGTSRKGASARPAPGDAGGFDPIHPGDGPKPNTFGGIDFGNGVGTEHGDGPGKSGHGHGPGGTGTGDVPVVRSERAVGAALNWLARHQMPDGSWSLKGYNHHCKDASCTGPGSEESLTAATGMVVLPFLAAGQTHASHGPYQATVAQGLYWLISHQKPDGDLYYVPAGEASQPHDWMYSHGVATIALCEAYGMTGDKNVKQHAQMAIHFIEKAQNQKTGGWRYSPGDDGDTSVVGWQMMALKSAEMAGLTVDQAALDGTKKWLNSVQAPLAAGGAGASGSYGSAQFSYQPGAAPSPTMTAVAVLCHQYLHAGRGDPVIVGGVKTLMENLPDGQNNHNVYYWYYATQVMHNMSDRDWDTWNRKMREVLILSQNREGCAAGSWDSDKPARDAWGQYGGRVMMTAFSCLTLEAPYRFLPLYKLDRPEDAVGPADKAKELGGAKEGVAAQKRTEPGNK